MAEAARPSGKLDSVQLLRAVAASMVVIGHLIGAATLKADMLGSFAKPHFAGGAGVDIFFLISGFIMVYTSGRMFGSGRGARDFLIRRLVRIVPLYWLVTLLTLGLAVVAGNRLPSLVATAASFLFFPIDTSGRGDGFAFPIVDLGWTLNYEMMFYLLFAAFIPWGRGRCVAAVSITLVALVAIGFFAMPGNVTLRFWMQPIILEFGAGMILAQLHLRGRFALSAAARIALAAAAVALYLWDPFALFTLPTTPNGFTRIGSWGVASALILIAAISGPTPLSGVFGKASVRLGDASYALYLLHPFVILVMLRVADHGLFSGSFATPLFILTGFAAAAIVSILFHLLVERPGTVTLTHLLQRLGVPIGREPLPPPALAN